MKRKSIIAISATAAILLLAAGLSFFLQFRNAEKALQTEKLRSAAHNNEVFQVSTFQVSPAGGNKLISGPKRFRDIVRYGDLFYAVTSEGLSEFTPEGKLRNHWSASNGLPSQDLTSAAVHNQALWIGTSEAGLIQYNGTAWKQFQPARKELRSIHSLHATTQGKLFIGTSQGLFSLESERIQPVHKEGLGNAFITALAGDAHRLFIGTFQNGLYLLAGGVLRHFDSKQGLQDGLITDIHETKEGCYVSTPSGIQVLEGDRFRTLAGNLFASSFEISNAVAWVALEPGGVIPVRTDAAKKRSFVRAPLEGPVVIRRVDDTVLALGNNGIHFLDHNGGWKAWGQDISTLSDSNVSAILRAQSGEFWIGYFDRGIDVLSADLQQKQHIESDTIFCVNHISQDSLGRIYVSTANGLAIFQPDRSVEVLREEDGLLSNRVMQTIPLDGAGNKVAIATTQGFSIREGRSIRSIYAFHGLINNHVYSMAPFRDQIFLGTLGGLSSVSRMQVTGNWNQADSGLKRNWINALLAIDDRLYLGTYGSGIQVRTPAGEWQDFPVLPEDLEINPNAFYSDGRFLFCGSLDRGAFIYDTKENQWRHLLAGLPGRNVTGFAADSTFLYIATDHGLLQISYENIRQLPVLS